jgi:hypothetical protein
VLNAVNTVNALTPPRFTSRAEFARRAGVSRAAVTKACRGPLGAALVEHIDLDHPAAVAYLQRSGTEVTDGAPTLVPSRAELAREVRTALRRLEAAIAAYVTVAGPEPVGERAPAGSDSDLAELAAGGTALLGAATLAPQIVDAQPHDSEAEHDAQPGAADEAEARDEHAHGDRQLRRGPPGHGHNPAHDSSVARGAEVNR